MLNRLFAQIIIVFFILLTFAQSGFANGRMAYWLQEWSEKEHDENTHPIIYIKDTSKDSDESIEVAPGIYPQISSDGNEIAYSEPHGTGYVIVTKNLQTGLIEQWTQTPDAFALMSDLSGNGRYLAFSAPLGETAASFDGAPRPKSKIAVIDLWAARNSAPFKQEGNRKIYSVNPELIPADGKSYFPELSSDGRFVVFHESFGAPTQGVRSATNKRVVLYDREKKTQIYLTSDTEYCAEPTISMDDRFIAMGCRVTEGGKENDDIYVVDRLNPPKKDPANPDQKLPYPKIRVTSDPGKDYTPTFRPDNSLVFSSDREKRFKEFRLFSAKRNSDETYTETGLFLERNGVIYNSSFSGDVELKQTIGKMHLIDGRSSFGIANMNGTPIIIGGNKGNQHDHSMDSIVNTAEVLKKDTWCADQGLCRPTPSQGFEAFYYDGKVFAVGGLTPDRDEDPSHSLDYAEVYDVKDKKWERVNLKENRSSYAGSQIGENAYLFYGWYSKGNFSGEYLKNGEILNLRTKKSTTFDLPSPYRRGFASAVWKNKIILVGGFNSIQVIKENGRIKEEPALMGNTDLFDPSAIGTDQMITNLPSLPFGAFSPTIAVAGDTLYAFGGVYPYGPSVHNDAFYVSHIYRLNLKNPSEGWIHTGRYTHEPKAFLRSLPSNDGKTVYLLGGHSFELGRTENMPVTTQEIWSLVDYSK